MSRPELQTPPELFYDGQMSRKYHTNSRMVGIQAEISERCIELLNIPVRVELLLGLFGDRSFGMNTEFFISTCLCQLSSQESFLVGEIEGRIEYRPRLTPTGYRSRGRYDKPAFNHYDVKLIRIESTLCEKSLSLSRFCLPSLAWSN